MGLGSQHVAQTRMPPLHFAGGSFLEALGRAFVCFQFRHSSSKSGADHILTAPLFSIIASNALGLLARLTPICGKLVRRANF
jgi:hypothetical protein